MRIPGSALIALITIGAAALSAQQTTTSSAPASGTPSQAAPQAPGVPAVATPAPLALPTGRVFGSDAGMILNPIRPDKVMEFEQVIGRLHDALARSTDPVRRQQAAGWKAFKAVEPGPNGSVLYVFVMDPAVKAADYTVSKILAEAFPTEVQDIYKLYIAAFAAGPSLVNMQLLEDFAQPVATTIPALPK